MWHRAGVSCCSQAWFAQLSLDTYHSVPGYIHTGCWHWQIVYCSDMVLLHVHDNCGAVYVLTACTCRKEQRQATASMWKRNPRPCPGLPCCPWTQRTPERRAMQLSLPSAFPASWSLMLHMWIHHYSRRARSILGRLLLWGVCSLLCA